MATKEQRMQAAAELVPVTVEIPQVGLLAIVRLGMKHGWSFQHTVIQLIEAGFEALDEPND